MGEELRVNTCGQKYTVVWNPEVGLRCLRYGEEWRDETGDVLILALASDLDEARKRIKELETCLHDLYDEQNGPPLYTSQDSWNEAMMRAQRLLSPNEPVYDYLKQKEV